MNRRSYPFSIIIKGWRVQILRRPFHLLPLHGVGAEVGVDRGKNAAAMLKRHPEITRLHLIDPYMEYEDNGHIESRAGRAKAEREAACRLSRFSDKLIWHKCTLKQCLLPPLDFAYIDGDHSYGAVKEDIAEVWKVLKPGGIMGGHDFIHTLPGGLTVAVEEFAARYGLHLFIETPDWWVVRGVAQ